MHLGVDEAGKGPVLGSMFVAAVRAEPASLPDDVADSKHLSAEKRGELAVEIRESASAVSVHEVPVERIDDPETDMNEVTGQAHARVITDIGWDDIETYADACDTSIARYERRLRTQLSVPVDLTAEHGADETYPIVSAASIIAKVERDAHIDELAETYGAIGSGYPGDTQTISFLESYVDEHGELPTFARRSWQTSQDVLDEYGQSSLSDF
jgi:ribonuclease HII